MWKYVKIHLDYAVIGSAHKPVIGAAIVGWVVWYVWTSIIRTWGQQGQPSHSDSFCYAKLWKFILYVLIRNPLGCYVAWRIRKYEHNYIQQNSI